MTTQCIANNGSDGQAEVPLWLCPCQECTKLDWQASDELGRTVSLAEFRRESFPEVWGG